MNRVKDAFQRRLTTLLDRTLSERTKRIVFLASFSAQLRPPKEFNSEMLHKLNKVLDLASDDAALKLPIHLSHAIWRNRPLDVGVKATLDAQAPHTEVQSLGVRILSVMPCWLRYGDDSKMLQDVERLLHNFQQAGA